VWRASDTRLDREVAVKRLSEHLDREPEFRRRFVGEARITARLDHPGIVPVYDLGDREGEHAYYAMKLVRGETLAAAIDHFHGLARNAPDRAVEERRLLNAFLTVCQTMEFSHARSVIHRDLKPQNIVLGDYGETIVLDWGLAKGRGEHDEEGPADPGNEAREAPLTRPGTVQGTPAYMAPEQAAGRIREVDERADIYALGGILYQVLTGRVPYEGASGEDVLRMVLDRAPPRPRALDPRVPPALEAICLRAMARESGDRYARVSALTRDVQRYLADEPVSVYAEPWRVRLGRWMRRHRTAVTGAAAATLMALAGLVVVAVVLAVSNERLDAANVRERAARQEAERQKAEADRERERAEANFRMAREAVDDYFTKVSEDRRLRARGLEGLRKELLRSAGAFYAEFVDQKSDDVRLNAERARALMRLGRITGETESQEKAVAILTRAVGRLQSLVDANPEEPIYLGHLAQCHERLGIALQLLRRHEEAERELRKGIEQLDRIPAPHREAALAQATRANIHHNLAVVYQSSGRLDAAAAALREALEIQERLVALRPDDAERRRILANHHMSLADLSEKMGRRADARTAAKEALRLCRELIDADPGEPEYPVLLAKIQTNLGAYYNRDNEQDKALASYQEALAVRRDLVLRHPEVPGYVLDLATTRLNLGALRFMQKKMREALEQFEEAATLCRALATRQPDNPRYRLMLAAVEINLGAIHADGGKLADAEAAYGKAASIFEDLSARFPSAVRYAIGAARATLQRGDVLVRVGREDEALGCYNAGLERVDAILEKTGPHADVCMEALRGLQGRARLHLKRERFALAAADWGRALDTLTEKMPEYRCDREAYRYQVGYALVMSGDHAGAAPIARRLADLPEGGHHFDAARIFALASDAAARDESLEEAARHEKVEAYGAAAVRALERGRKRGLFKDPAMVRQLDLLTPLEGREDFRALIERIRGK